MHIWRRMLRISDFSTYVMGRHLKFLHIWNIYRKRRHKWKNLCYFLEKNQFCENLRTLSRNPFCCNLRTFVWRKIYPKLFFVEKKWQIWGLLTSTEKSLLPHWKSNCSCLPSASPPFRSGLGPFSSLLTQIVSFSLCCKFSLNNFALEPFKWSPGI